MSSCYKNPGHSRDRGIYHQPAINRVYTRDIIVNDMYDILIQIGFLRL